MSRIPTGAAKVRLNLELSPRVRERLEKLRRDTEADTLVEVIRRSLAVYDTFNAALGDGARIFVKYEDGSEKEVLIP